MASGDLLRKLFRGYAKHDDATFRAALDNIIEEERAKNHRLLADTSVRKAAAITVTRGATTVG